MDPASKDLAGKTLYAHYTTNGAVTFNVLSNNASVMTWPVLSNSTTGKTWLASGDKLAAWQVPTDANTTDGDDWGWYTDVYGGTKATPAGATAGSEFFLFSAPAKPVLVSYDKTTASSDSFATELKEYRAERADDVTAPQGYVFGTKAADWKVQYTAGGSLKTVSIAQYNKDGAPEGVTAVKLVASAGTSDVVTATFAEYKNKGDNSANKVMYLLKGSSVNDSKRFKAPSDNDDFAFNGWTYVGTDGKAVKATLNEKLRDDLAYTAQWTSKTKEYTLTFDPYYDGSPAPTSVKVKEGTKYGDIDAPTPTRAGYVFDGWYIGNTKLVSYDSEETAGVFDPSTTKVTANTTFTAKWLTNDQATAKDYAKTAAKVLVKGFNGAKKNDVRFTAASLAEYKKVVDDIDTTKTDPANAAYDTKYTAEAQKTLAAAQKKLVQKANTKVYRAYNPNNGDHLLTVNEAEHNAVVKLGWKAEGVGFKAALNPISWSGSTEAAAYQSVFGTKVYRVYNPNNGEHLLTSSKGEAEALAKIGWNLDDDENKNGVLDADEYQFLAPQGATKTVYRVYNKNSGFHHYTTNKAEANNLVKLGWSLDSVKFKAE